MSAGEKAIAYFFRKTFDIREGELLRAVLMQLNIFLVISTLLMVKPAVNGLFISKFGVENLPRAFVLVALAAALVSALYSRGLSRLSFRRIITATLSTSVLTLVLFGVLLRLNVLEGWVLYLFYIWVSIFAVLSASQFWILANLVFNAREAKRLFGFIGSGAIAGGIFGGYLTTILAPVIGSENLLFVSALLLSFCIPLSGYAWTHFVATAHTPFRQTKQLKGFSENPLRLIRHSRHLSYLASIIGVSVIVAKLVDYQFSAIAAANIADADALTAFFGLWFSNFNVISLLVQLFLTRRVVGVFGVGYSLLFLPAGILVGAVLLLFIPELWVAVLLKLSDGSLKQSINKAAIELLGLPIPVEVKNQTKTFIDVFIDSAATGLGGLILIFLVTGLDLSTRAISLMTIVLLALWVYFAFRVRAEYLRSFRSNIDRVRNDQAGEQIDIRSESVIGGLRKILEQGSEKEMLYVLRKVRELSDERLFEPVRALLSHHSDKVRAEALHNLYFYSHYDLSEEVEKLIRDPYQKVKIQAFEYLIRRVPDEKVALMNTCLEDPDERVRGAALVSLALETRDNPALRSLFGLEDRIRQAMNALITIEDPKKRRFHYISLLKTIGYANIPGFFPFIGEAFADEDPQIVRQAILSAGHTLSPSFIDPLIGFLSGTACREHAKTALIHYGHGIIKVLDNLVQNNDPGVETLRILPEVVETIDSQRSVDLLFVLLDHDDLSVQLAALRSLNQLKMRFPHLSFYRKDLLRRIMDEARLYLDMLSVLYVQTAVVDAPPAPGGRREDAARRALIHLLENRLDHNLERIFRYLGLKYPTEDVISIFEGVRSKRPDLRINALEFLDNLLTPNLKKMIIPIIETALLDSISEEVVRGLNLKVPNEAEGYRMLLMGKDRSIRLAVLKLIAQSGNPRFRELATPYLQHEDPGIRQAAQMTLDDHFLS